MVVFFFDFKGRVVGFFKLEVFVNVNILGLFGGFKPVDNGFYQRIYTQMGIGGNFDDLFADFFLKTFHSFVKVFRCQKVSFIDTDYLRKPGKFCAVSVKFPVDFYEIVVRIAPF